MVRLGEVLRDSGHRVVFATTKDWSQRLKSLGFGVELMTEETDGVAGDSADANAESANDLLDNSTPLEKALKSMTIMLKEFLPLIEKDEPSLKRIINAVKPDVIISDHVLTLPSIAGSGIPWIFSYSSNPLSLDFGYEDKRLPPSILGLSINSDKNLWEEYRQQLKDARKDDWIKYKDWLISNGCPLIPEELQFWSPSPFANIYMFPKELDYTDVRPLPKTFHRFDCMKRSGNEDTFELPDKLKNRSGKLIYLSLGSMGSADV
ncbi:unnamed protein product, partial [Medioppia subpectinata]